MNRSQAQEIWFLIKAFGEGVVIQYFNNNTWQDEETISSAGLATNPSLYRIKLEPEEVWVNKYDNDADIHVHISKERALQYSDPELPYEYIAKRFVEAELEEE